MTWVFVYAADSGPWAAVLDGVHKLVSPDTYACGLCRITHGVWGPRREWTEALGRLGGTQEFYHRDEFVRRFPGRPVTAPSVWKVEEAWTLVLGPEDWETIETVADLEKRLVAETLS